MPKTDRMQTNRLLDNKVYECKGIWNKPGGMISDSEISQRVSCITDTRNRKRYYINDSITGNKVFLGYESKFNSCIIESKRHIVECKSSVSSNNTGTDFLKIAAYIARLTESGDVEDFIINFIESLLFYTDVSLDDVIEILKGGFVILEGDRGLYYELYHHQNYLYSRRDRGETSHYSIVDQARMGKGDILPLSQMLMSSSFAKFELIMGQNFKLPGTTFDKTVAATFRKLSKSRKNKYMSVHRKYISTWFQFELSRGSGSSYDPVSYNPISGLTGKPTMVNIGHGVSTTLHYITKAMSVLGASVRNIGPFGASVYSEDNPLIVKLCKPLLYSRSVRRDTSNQIANLYRLGHVKFQPCDFPRESSDDVNDIPTPTIV